MPVTVVTGFLGSGKTTLLNHLLRDPAMADTAVIINEFGEIPIDHLLVETALENTLVLQSGCICCSVRGDLVDTLADLAAKRERGAIPAFSRVAIETTGLADPAPILMTLASDRSVAPRFRLRSLVTMVDAVHARSEIARFPEAVKQIALADVVAVTKTDLVDQGTLADIETRLKAINPGVALVAVVHGEIAPDTLFGLAPDDPRANPSELARWLDAEAFEAHDHAHPDGHHDHHHHDDPNRHGADIRAFCLTVDAPLPWKSVEAWLASITSLRGEDLLRLKGILNIAGEPGPVVIHGVQHLLHPVTRLARWPGADRLSRIVFITRGIPEAALKASLVVLSGAA